MNTLHEYNGTTVTITIERSDGEIVRLREIALNLETEDFLLLVDNEGELLTPSDYAGDVDARAFLGAARQLMRQIVD